MGTLSDLNDILGKKLAFTFSDISGGMLVSIMGDNGIVGLAFQKKTPYYAVVGQGEWGTAWFIPLIQSSTIKLSRVP